jgi:hypothetical protein
MSNILTSSSKSYFNFKEYIHPEFEGKFGVYLCSHAQEKQCKKE